MNIARTVWKNVNRKDHVIGGRLDKEEGDQQYEFNLVQI